VNSLNVEENCASTTTSFISALLCLCLWIVTFDDHASCETPSREVIDLMRAENADTISFAEKVAFISPSGEEITPSPGSYRVQSVGASALRLVPFEKKRHLSSKPSQGSMKRTLVFRSHSSRSTTSIWFMSCCSYRSKKAWKPSAPRGVDATAARQSY
jgi:hypothetical protein